MDQAEVIRFFRKQNGLSQADLAALLNISKRAIQSWEQGKRKPLGSAARLLQLLIVHPENVEIINHIKEDTLMVDLDIDREHQTIMGVPFSTRKLFDATVDAVLNNMYEGYQPTKSDIELYAKDITLTPAEALQLAKEELEVKQNG